MTTPDPTYKIPDPGNDPEWLEIWWDQENPGGRNWHLEAIKMPEAWDITTGGESVRVGVVDMGFKLDHIDIFLPPGNGFSANGDL